MNYEQTIELENNIKIKNQADQLYKDFKRYFTLNVGSFKNGRFTVWADSHNAAYIALEKNTFVFMCRFLHESYDVRINPSSLFTYIKEDYRGIGHFRSAVSRAKQRYEEQKK